MSTQTLNTEVKRKPGRPMIEGKTEDGKYISRIRNTKKWRDNNREHYLEYQNKCYIFRKEAKRLFSIEI